VTGHRINLERKSQERKIKKGTERNRMFCVLTYLSCLLAIWMNTMTYKLQVSKLQFPLQNNEIQSIYMIGTLLESIIQDRVKKKAELQVSVMSEVRHYRQKSIHPMNDWPGDSGINQSTMHFSDNISYPLETHHTNCNGSERDRGSCTTCSRDHH